MLALFPFLVTDWNTWALATYSLGVAADLCFFTKICPAVSMSVSSASVARRSAVFGPKPCHEWDNNVTDYDERYPDPHGCWGSCSTPGRGCSACTNTDYFRCPLSGVCIPPALRCDGHPQCHQAEDGDGDTCFKSWVTRKNVSPSASSDPPRTNISVCLQCLLLHCYRPRQQTAAGKGRRPINRTDKWVRSKMARP